jgi:hypothetical protein
MSSDKSCACLSDDASRELAERRKRIAADVISALTRAGVAAKVVFPEGDDTPTKGKKA